MLNHLRFADDTALLAHTPQEAERIVRQLDEVGKKVGLQLNAKKTKVMRNGFADPSAVRLGQTTLEDTDERKRGAWAAYNTIKSAVSEIENQKLRAELFNSTVILALRCGSEVWTLTKVMEAQLKTTQASIEKHMVGYTLRRQRCKGLHNSDIRSLFKATDALEYANHSKHR
ncbi:hypothetical protein Y032_0010g998 [Ancylostoma ceylanicum]|uniref:Reverse transcriptase domain-containing protein n=1 Tax=Ancylostoma ceylanicum TaxID=53326 RepID=A0A016VJA3_9BILA|nr:hypothetical protein Y032_0010g998 [Ancylostoma ceylanicum]